MPMRPSRATSILTATLGLLSSSLAGCAPEESPRAWVTERDSAGVHIVETLADLYLRPDSRDPEKDRAERMARSRSLPTLPYLPAVSDLRVDTQGNLWLQLYRLLSRDSQSYARRNGRSVQTEPYQWILLDPRGRLLGSVATPARLEITDIGDDYVLGWWTDEQAVQHVGLYAPEKREAPVNPAGASHP